MWCDGSIYDLFLPHAAAVDDWIVYLGRMFKCDGWGKLYAAPPTASHNKLVKLRVLVFRGVCFFLAYLLDCW